MTENDIVYEVVLTHELKKYELKKYELKKYELNVERQVPVPIEYEGITRIVNGLDE